MRVCLDAPVLAAAFTTRGPSADVLRLVLARHRLVCGRPVLSELRRLLTQRLQVPVLAADQIIPFLREQAEVSSPRQPVAAGGANQGWVLASAIEAAADVLVMHRRGMIQIPAPPPLTVTDLRGFWELVRHGRQYASTHSR
jgi:hypothetical protein